MHQNLKNTYQQILINESSQDRLVIDNSNVILQVNYGENFTFKGNDTNRILEEFEKQIIKGILKEFSITEFVRVGYIRRYIFNEEDLIDSFIKRIAGEKLKQVNDMNLRFSKKIPLLESLAERDTYDYENAIFNIIKKADLDNEIFMAIDYQRYYNPHLSVSTQIEFKPFLDKVISFNNNQFLSWLNSYYLESENE